jgi:hypothetical protein
MEMEMEIGKLVVGKLVVGLSDSRVPIPNIPRGTPMIRWKKVYRDLWINRSRTILVVLSIAAGVFAIGLIGATQQALTTSLASQYAELRPADAIFETDPVLDDDFVTSIRNMRGVDEAEGRRALLSLDLTVGESVAPTLPIAFLADTSVWTVETKDLAEIDVANVAIDDPVTIKLDAFPGEEFKGTVVEIDPVGREYLGDMTYKVTIALDEPDPRFLWNMTATVNID